MTCKTTFETDRPHSNTMKHFFLLNGLYGQKVDRVVRFDKKREFILNGQLSFTDSCPSNDSKCIFCVDNERILLCWFQSRTIKLESIDFFTVATKPS
jgi:hypothetical protein